MKIVRLLFIITALTAALSSCKNKDNTQSTGEISDELESSVEQFENRKKYSSFTAEILKSIPDANLETAVIDYIIDVKLKGRERDEYSIIKGMSPAFRYIYITWALDGEVNNGGFIQYFYNTSGMYAADLTDALRNIRAYKTEKIAADAIALYNKERALHEKVRKEGSMESFMSSYGESELGKLDELFYKTGEDLSKLRIRYIRSNPDQFVTK